MFSDPIENVQIKALTSLAIEGSSYWLTCNATGPIDFIYWMKNGEPLQVGNRIIFSMDNKTITFMPVDRSDSGIYQCKAISVVENVISQSYNLLVNCEFVLSSLISANFYSIGHHTI